MEERIICAAIQHPSTGEIFYGHRHNHCLAAMNDKLSWTMNRQQISTIHFSQGFITSNGRYVDRIEALIIALNENQVLNKDLLRNNKLYSEDLY